MYFQSFNSGGGGDGLEHIRDARHVKYLQELRRLEESLSKPLQLSDGSSAEIVMPPVVELVEGGATVAERRWAVDGMLFAEESLRDAAAKAKKRKASKETLQRHEYILSELERVLAATEAQAKAPARKRTQKKPGELI